MWNVGYNGVHVGDFLTLEEVKPLADELAHLDGLECDSRVNTEMIQVFREKLFELVDASQSANKPICF